MKTDIKHNPISWNTCFGWNRIPTIGTDDICRWSGFQCFDVFNYGRKTSSTRKSLFHLGDTSISYDFFVTIVYSMSKRVCYKIQRVGHKCKNLYSMFVVLLYSRTKYDMQIFFIKKLKIKRGVFKLFRYSFRDKIILSLSLYV